MFLSKCVLLSIKLHQALQTTLSIANPTVVLTEHQQRAYWHNAGSGYHRPTTCRREQPPMEKEADKMFVSP